MRGWGGGGGWERFVTPRAFEVKDLGVLPYAEAYQIQRRFLDEVIQARERGPNGSVGVVLLLEHEPIITISRRARDGNHLLADEATLARQGVGVVETDRGGDITYHGPGQLVAYPILDLNRLGLGLHGYMRALESAVIATCGRFGIHARPEPGATGVWVDPSAGGTAAKICAMGVRVRRWVTMHGLALNVTTNLEHFRLIVPCGLVGREPTSMERLLGDACPPMDRVKSALVQDLAAHLTAKTAEAESA